MAGTISLAVNEAQQGKLGASFDRLDKHGAVVPCTLAINSRN